MSLNARGIKQLKGSNFSMKSSSFELRIPELKAIRGESVYQDILPDNEAVGKMHEHQIYENIG
jgi:hypothetical protein